MKVLVTGGSGFLGSHVADALTKKGHDVVVFDQHESRYLSANQTMAVGSILDLDAFEAAISGCDAIYHLAALADLDEAINKPLETIETNIIGTANALHLASQFGLSRFIYASTIYVYSDHGSFYRTSKRVGELLIEDYWEKYELQYTILRFGSLYGPRADQHNSIYRVLKQALNQRSIDYPGTGDEVREYINVVDAAKAAAHILEGEFVNENISLTGRERLKTREMFEMIKEILGDKIDINFRFEPDPGHYFQTPYSYTPKVGRKLVLDTYIDLGLGLLECIEEIDDRANEIEEVRL